MEGSQIKKIFSEKGYPFAKMDELMELLRREVKEGYVLARRDKERRYLFVIAERLYCGGLVEGKTRKTTSLEEFFQWYEGVERADVSLYSADKKLLLCFLVMLSYSPQQSFTTDRVAFEDVIKKIEQAGEDTIMSLLVEGRLSFVIFIKGKPVFLFLPGEATTEGSPLERLLLYAESQEKPLSVEVYKDIKVKPSEDSVPLKDESVRSLYTTEPKGAWVELFEEGLSKGRFPVAERLTIGRETTNAIVLEEAGVSREHAVVEKKGDKYIIKDLDSANGTYFKGIRIETKELFDGDEIKIRRYLLKFHLPEKKAKPEEKEEATTPSPSDREVLELEPALEVRERAHSRAYLEFEDGSTHRLGSITTIGKDEDADIRVEGLLVARRHAVIIKGRDLYKIVRKGGLSSLKVNGEKATEKVLQDGDIIEVGGLKMTFRIEPQEAS